MHFSRYASSRKTNFLFYRSELFRGRRGAVGSITHETAIWKEISMSENMDYTHPEVLVDAGWLQAHLADPMVRLIEVDVDTTAYQRGHIPGAVGFNWKKDLQDQVIRAPLRKVQLEALLSRTGVSLRWAACRVAGAIQSA